MIRTDQGGSVFLIAPQVENSGVILSPAGQIGLIAANAVQLLLDTSTSSTRTALVIYVPPTSTLTATNSATNSENGWMIADSGMVGMYGGVVNQNGLIRSITAVQKGGAIELQASLQINTGPNSLTACDISDSSDAVVPSASGPVKGDIFLGGLMTAPSATGNPYGKSATGTIDLRGTIRAPSGNVNLYARDAVYVRTGGSIDVSGVWVDKTADANLVQMQLTSVELRDDYGQKAGLLKGQTIDFDALVGSKIGNISASLTTQSTTAREQAVTGGAITITGGPTNTYVTNVVVEQGASIKFAGGGTNYGPGFVDTTVLRSGNTATTIDNASEWVAYDQILNSQQVTYKRYGITQQFNGIYTGGSNNVRNYVGQRLEGADAGSLTIQPRNLVLNGTLDGSVTKGLYQTRAMEILDSSGNALTSGTAEPRGGELILGLSPSGNLAFYDAGLENVVIEQNVSASGNQPNPAASAVLSAKILSDARLGRLEIYANKTVTIDAGAVISIPSRRYLSYGEKFDTSGNLTPAAAYVGGLFVAEARKIDVLGTVNVPAGEIDLTLSDNKTSANGNAPVPLDHQRISLGDSSSLTVAGQEISNYLVSQGGALQTGQIGGGLIKIKDTTLIGEGVVVKKRAQIDVSGGFSIDPKGAVTGGDAGSVDIEGRTLVLDGTIKGLSIPGNKGGSLKLIAYNDVRITPAAPAPLPDNFTSTMTLPASRTAGGVGLTLGQSQFSETGFTSLDIESQGNLSVANGVSLMPSTAKLALPTAYWNISGNGTVRNNLSGLGVTDSAVAGVIHVSPDTISTSSVTLVAGGRHNRRGQCNHNMTQKAIHIILPSILRRMP